LGLLKLSKLSTLAELDSIVDAEKIFFAFVFLYQTLEEKNFFLPALLLLLKMASITAAGLSFPKIGFSLS